MKACLLTRVPILINSQGIKRREDSERGGAIILNISVKGGRWIEERLLLEEIRSPIYTFIESRWWLWTLWKKKHNYLGHTTLLPRKSHLLNDWHCIWHIYCDLTVNWLWKSLKSRQYQNNNTIANLKGSFYLLSSLFLYIHCNTYTHWVRYNYHVLSSGRPARRTLFM